MRTHLELPIFRQQTGYECGNTSLKSVLWYLGRRRSAKYLRRLCRVRSDGVDHRRVVDAARKLGATVFTKQAGTIADLRWFLRRELPVIVGWWSRDLEAGDLHFCDGWTLAERKRHDCGHYSVVSGVSNRTVTLMDPQQELSRGHWRGVGNVSMSHRAFLDVWYDTDTDRYVKIDRWLMVVNFDGERFRDRVRGGRDHLPLDGHSSVRDRAKD